MKKTKLLLLIFSVFLVLAACQEATDEDYQKWKKESGVKFRDGEDAYRVYIYKANLKKIEEHNADPNAEYQEEQNQFTGFTNEEFKLLFLGAIPPQEEPEVDLQIEEDQPNADQEEGEEGDLTTGIIVNAIASSIDWRDLNGVTPVRGQGACGSCWAFSTVAALEAAFLIKKKVTLDLSEQQLVSCTVGTYKNYGCNGGWPDRALNYVLNEGGITSEESYPYKAVTGTCSKNGGQYKISKVVTTPNSKCGAIRRKLQIRPVSVLVDASDWGSYKSGVFKCDSASINHAVLLVGYTEKLHWIIKNSWGTWWGDKGFMTINKRAVYNCGICKYGCDLGIPI